MKIIQEILQGNHRAIAQAITKIENQTAEGREILKRIYPHSGKSLVLGVTGAPGSGKSTLVDQMIALYRKEKKKIGIIAVDPSSPFTGGAVLGDRIRMMRHSGDAGVFIRSMATRGHMGGISRAAWGALAVLEAAGMDLILIETVGVGQDEVEVVKLAELILVILNPGAGDDIQTFKAGLMEIADIFVLNKADSPEIDNLQRHLRAMLEIGYQENRRPPVIKTVASTGEGVLTLKKKIGAVSAAKEKQYGEQGRKNLIRRLLMNAVREEFFLKLEGAVSKEEIQGYVDRICRREIDPFFSAEQIIAKIGGEGHESES